MKARNPNTGNLETIYVKALDSLPVGSEIDIEDGSDIPVGWEEVTNPDSYSTTEVKTNKTWIDGKPVYRIIIDCGALPNATLKRISFSSLDYDMDAIIKFSGCAYLKDNSNKLSAITLPFYASNDQYGVQIFLGTDDIQITTGKDRTAYTHTYIEIEYTKTTD